MTTIITPARRRPSLRTIWTRFFIETTTPNACIAVAKTINAAPKPS